MLRKYRRRSHQAQLNSAALAASNVCVITIRGGIFWRMKCKESCLHIQQLGYHSCRGEGRSEERFAAIADKAACLLYRSMQQGVRRGRSNTITANPPPNVLSDVPQD